MRGEFWWIRRENRSYLACFTPLTTQPVFCVSCPPRAPLEPDGRCCMPPTRLPVIKIILWNSENVFAYGSQAWPSGGMPVRGARERVRSRPCSHVFRLKVTARRRTQRHARACWRTHRRSGQVQRTLAAYHWHSWREQLRGATRKKSRANERTAPSADIRSLLPVPRISSWRTLAQITLVAGQRLPALSADFFNAVAPCCDINLFHSLTRHTHRVWVRKPAYMWPVRDDAPDRPTTRRSAQQGTTPTVHEPLSQRVHSLRTLSKHYNRRLRLSSIHKHNKRIEFVSNNHNVLNQI